MFGRRLRITLAVALLAIVAGLCGGAWAQAAGDDGGTRAADATESCHTNVACAGQVAGGAIGPLTPVQSGALVALVALVTATIVVGRAPSWPDRLAASRLFRPPRPLV
jgi:hypothetical protein